MKNHKQRMSLRLLAAKLNSRANGLAQRRQNAQLQSHQALGFTLREIEGLVLLLQKTSTEIWALLDDYPSDPLSNTTTSMSTDELAEQPTVSELGSDATARPKRTSSTSASARQVDLCPIDFAPAEPWPSGNDQR